MTLAAFALASVMVSIDCLSQAPSATPQVADRGLFLAPTARKGQAGVVNLGTRYHFPVASIEGPGNLTLTGALALNPFANEWSRKDGPPVLLLAPKWTFYQKGHVAFAIGGLAAATTRWPLRGGIVYGVATFGGSDAGLSIAAFTSYSRTKKRLVGHPTIMVGIEKRLGPRSKFVSENYLVGEGEYAVVVTTIYRHFVRAFSLDAGLMLSPVFANVGIPAFPLLGVSVSL